MIFLNIKVFDTTLRDGEQTPGVSLTQQEKLRIATKLDEIGIDYCRLDKDANIRRWNAGEVSVGLIHPASAGHGLNLQSGGNILVWFGSFLHPSEKN